MSTYKREKHNRELSNKEEVTFFAVYVGSIGVERSMRTMQYDLRTAVTKEAIVKVCTAAKCKQDVMKRPKAIKQINKILCHTPKVVRLGVNFSISLNGLVAVRSDNHKPLLNHVMSSISFASSGEPPFKSFVGYVAKDATHGRACHVLNCFGDAFDVISTIGEAFSIKYNDVLTKHTQNPSFEFIEVNDGFFTKIFDEEENTTNNKLQNTDNNIIRSRSDNNLAKLYENIPRRAVNSNPCQPRTVQNSIFYIPKPEERNVWPRTNYCPSPPGSPQIGRRKAAKDDMEIRRSTPSSNTDPVKSVPVKPAPVKPAPVKPAPVKPPRPKMPIYANVQEVLEEANIQESLKEPVQETCTKTVGVSSDYCGTKYVHVAKSPEGEQTRATPDELRRNLEELECSLDEISSEKQLPQYQKMSWFHGKISREEAERRLKYQGDYLVRSHGNGQFVLTCMDNTDVRHLLLVDPHGQIRTRDRKFVSITDLITHYATSGECIVSEGCTLRIIRPVPHAP